MDTSKEVTDQLHSVEDSDPSAVGKEVEVNTFSTEESFRQVILIQLARLYDLQLAFLTGMDPKLAAYIGDLHKNGEFFGPDPAILVPSES